jgi:hypothetical protein
MIVSKFGRAQDAVHDILYGYDAPSGPLGIIYFQAGPLCDMPAAELSELVDRIVDVVANIICGEQSG